MSAQKSHSPFRLQGQQSQQSSLCDFGSSNKQIRHQDGGHNHSTKENVSNAVAGVDVFSLDNEEDANKMRNKSEDRSDVVRVELAELVGVGQTNNNNRTDFKYNGNKSDDYVQVVVVDNDSTGINNYNYNYNEAKPVGFKNKNKTRSRRTQGNKINSRANNNGQQSDIEVCGSSDSSDCDEMGKSYVHQTQGSVSRFHQRDVDKKKNKEEENFAKVKKSNANCDAIEDNHHQAAATIKKQLINRTRTGSDSLKNESAPETNQPEDSSLPNNNNNRDKRSDPREDNNVPTSNLNSNENKNKNTITTTTSGQQVSQQEEEEEAKIDKEASASIGIKIAQSSKNNNNSKKKNGNKKISTYVLDPSGSLCYHWSMVVSFAFLYNFWSLSYRFAFREIDFDTVAFWFALDYSADFIYILDVIINFHTGYLEDGVLERNIDKISVHYRECTLFYLDCFCLLPLDILYLSIGFNSILRCTRLVKIYKFWFYVDRTERHTNYPNVFRTFTLVHYILVIFHWNACLFHMISKNKIIDIENLYKINDNRCDDILCQYLHAFYWSTLALTTIGDLPRPRTKGEYIYITVELFFGLFLFASVLGHVANIVTNVSAARKEFQAKLDAVKTFMRMRRVSDDLQNKVIRWFDYLWISQKSSDEERSVACLPDRLKAEIAIHVHLDTLKRVDIFQNTEAGFLCELVLRLKPVLFSPGDYVCRKNEVGHEMYIVSRGILEVVTDGGKQVVATLKAGSYFGEISVLNVGLAGNKRTASVRSVGYSDLFCLNKQDLWDVLKNYPNAEARIRARAEERLSKLKKSSSTTTTTNEPRYRHQHQHHQGNSNKAASLSSQRLPASGNLMQHQAPSPSVAGHQCRTLLAPTNNINNNYYQAGGSINTGRAKTISASSMKMMMMMTNERPRQTRSYGMRGSQTANFQQTVPVPLVCCGGVLGSIGGDNNNSQRLATYHQATGDRKDCFVGRNGNNSGCCAANNNPMSQPTFYGALNNNIKSGPHRSSSNLCLATAAGANLPRCPLHEQQQDKQASNLIMDNRHHMAAAASSIPGSPLAAGCGLIHAASRQDNDRAAEGAPCISNKDHFRCLASKADSATTKTNESHHRSLASCLFDQEVACSSNNAAACCAAGHNKTTLMACSGSDCGNLEQEATFRAQQLHQRRDQATGAAAAPIGETKTSGSGTDFCLEDKTNVKTIATYWAPNRGRPLTTAGSSGEDGYADENQKHHEDEEVILAHRKQEPNDYLDDLDECPQLQLKLPLQQGQHRSSCASIESDDSSGNYQLDEEVSVDHLGKERQNSRNKCFSANSESARHVCATKATSKRHNHGRSFASCHRPNCDCYSSQHHQQPSIKTDCHDHHHSHHQHHHLTCPLLQQQLLHQRAILSDQGCSLSTAGRAHKGPAARDGQPTTGAILQVPLLASNATPEGCHHDQQQQCADEMKQASVSMTHLNTAQEQQQQPVLQNHRRRHHQLPSSFTALPPPCGSESRESRIELLAQEDRRKESNECSISFEVQTDGGEQAAREVEIEVEEKRDKDSGDELVESKLLLSTTTAASLMPRRGGGGDGATSCSQLEEPPPPPAEAEKALPQEEASFQDSC